MRCRIKHLLWLTTIAAGLMGLSGWIAWENLLPNSNSNSDLVSDWLPDQQTKLDSERFRQEFEGSTGFQVVMANDSECN